MAIRHSQTLEVLRLDALLLHDLVHLRARAVHDDRVQADLRRGTAHEPPQPRRSSAQRRA